LGGLWSGSTHAINRYTTKLLGNFIKRYNLMYELVILAQLMAYPAHGYLIAKIINDNARLSSGRLYPLLVASPYRVQCIINSMEHSIANQATIDANTSTLKPQ
jgi:hypothetical protein